MVSSELEMAIRRVLSKIGEDPIEVWKPWIDVTYESGFDLPSLLTVFVWHGSKSTIIQIRRAPVYQEFVKLPSIAPWSELFSIADDGCSIRLNQSISDEDWGRIRDIANEYVGGVGNIPTPCEAGDAGIVFDALPHHHRK